MTMVDANVLLDIFTADREWLAWSLAQLEKAALNGPLLINDVIYAEASTRYREVSVYEDALREVGVAVAPIPHGALFLAGKAFAHYRDAGGVRTGVSADFFIGAHAAVEHIPLLTRDVRRYRTHFPTLQLISPVVS
ncbi:type II toxin-antitoxin system VapC family toxin [Tardiphaga sp.]|uniref:type II toxin-antitoxin system VapC family toxin n=1 Tax=Tardiphaga sp. TaxID=1926292 RepID=UPI002621955B|nr:type II toxin-antitoxin system VapC family toxin [Tardiphaga sp.]MDB5616391.1 PilT protein-like [Tardiphaga sp.]